MGYSVISLLSIHHWVCQQKKIWKWPTLTKVRNKYSYIFSQARCTAKTVTTTTLVEILSINKLPFFSEKDNLDHPFQYLQHHAENYRLMQSDW